MVQYIHTPWRDRAELLKVRRQFYPYPPPPPTASSITAGPQESQDHEQDDDDETEAAAEAEKQRAVSRVSMWMQRGGCPHLVESTALLMAAVLSDLHESRTRANSSSYAIRAAYSAAFSRYVTIASCLFDFFFSLYIKTITSLLWEPLSFPKILSSFPASSADISLGYAPARRSSLRGVVIASKFVPIHVALRMV